ncbi:glycosyltransferase [Cellulophaga tyrosinoxydans]|uniref:Glycosyl transferase family 2 n=1 Tax=Cellulophaga tyrosinoxydans TaxID=504486 RepID=A0A1W1YQL6_9FLAO|nr:glycosyltransferase [Cellulophaga tyrosinoxydans]SMC38426.1 Glycosyl transferase family 2 [Cellulophaga tyrosinoxydans]
MISVCIATYNGEKYIKEQLLSIIKQLGPNDEIIISDDGSYDNTLDVVKNLDQRIKIVFNSKEKGYTKNFENAISHANGKYIFLSDQDDVWVDNKVEIMMGYLKKYDLVISDAEICNNILEPTGLTYHEATGGQGGFLYNFYKIRHIGACLAFRSTMKNKLLPFPNNQKLYAHDIWIPLIGELYYKTKIISKPLVFYRRHNTNTSRGTAPSLNSLFFKIRMRLYTLKNLLQRIVK